MKVIFWQDDTRPRYAKPNLDCGLSISEIAEIVVPKGKVWEAMDKEQAEIIVGPYDKAESAQSRQLTFYQLLIGLVSEGWITEVEGEGWLTGNLPQSVLKAILDLPQEQQFTAKVHSIRPAVVSRNDIIVQALSEAKGKSNFEVDDFFINYEKI